MRIFVIGGAARSLINFRGTLLKSMIARGHEVVACAPDASVEIKSELAQMGCLYREVPLSRAGINFLKDVKTFFVLFWLFCREQPDAVLTYTAKPVIWGCIAARIARIPTSYSMITGLGYAFTHERVFKQKLVRRIVCALYRIALSRVRVVFFQNPDDQREFQARGLIKNSTQCILINGSGVDTYHFTPESLPETPVFLLMARLVADKGIREYREAARLLRCKYPRARFLLAGGFDSNPNAVGRKEIGRWQEEGDIEYLGRLEDVRPTLAKIRVYVLPSYYREGTPRSILEAMSAGRPVITTDWPGCRETVERLGDTGMSECRNAENFSRRVESFGNGGGRILRGTNGFLVPVKDSGALAEAMEKFIEQPGLAETMGRQSRRIAEEKYDVHKVNRVILEAMGA